MKYHTWPRTPNGKVTKAQRLIQKHLEVSPFPAGDYKAVRHRQGNNKSKTDTNKKRSTKEVRGVLTCTQNAFRVQLGAASYLFWYATWPCLEKINVWPPGLLNPILYVLYLSFLRNFTNSAQFINIFSLNIIFVSPWWNVTLYVISSASSLFAKVCIRSHQYTEG